MNKPKVVHQYLEILHASTEVMTKQSECIKSAIALRLLNQDIIELLEAINTTGTLTDTITALVGLTREFDTLAMEYGPYPKAAYIQSIVSRSKLGNG